MDRQHKIAIILLGFAWPAAGLGFLALQFGYLPSGLNLMAQAVGLFFSGVLSGFLYLGVRRVFTSVLSLSLVNIGYVLFAPIGLLASLLAPGLVEEAGAPASMALITPVMIVIYSNSAIAAGLGLTGTLAIVAKVIAERIQPSRAQAENSIPNHR